jgi:hypothetical protein
MSGVVLGLAMFIATLLLHLAASHTLAIANKERALVRFMLVACAGYSLGFPLGIAPVRAITGAPVVHPLVDFFTGAAALGFLVLGYVEFWSLIERSFSLRILIDTAAAEDGLTRSDIAASYAGGLGLEWMMDKRIDDLVGSGMLRTDAPRQLSRRGRLVGQAFLGLRRLLGTSPSF